MNYFGLSDQQVAEADARIARLVSMPKISIVIPLYETPYEFLNACLQSILDQTYKNVEIIIVDDSREHQLCRHFVERIAPNDERVKYSARVQNGGIAAATNDGLSMCSGDVVAFIDHDDELLPNAILILAEHIAAEPEFDVWYSDQVKCDLSGQVTEHLLKPRWSPTYFLGVMYVGHLLAVRREFTKIVKFNSDFDGVQDYEFMLRLSCITTRISHIPAVLYKWRSAPGSLAANPAGKPGIEQLQCRAAQEHVRRLGYSWQVHPVENAFHRMAISRSENTRLPSTSIIIPTKNQGSLIARCLESLKLLTMYPNLEIIVVDNRTTEPFARQAIARSECKHIIFDREFNFSEACNLGASHSNSEILLFLNNDTEILDQEWLSKMTIFFEDQGVGAVGATLLYPDSTVQHAGVVLGPRGTADHVMRGFKLGWDGYAGSLKCSREVSCATAACLAIRKSLFDSVGGFDTIYNNHYQDVDLCLKVISSGYRIINSASTRIIHHESISRKDDGYDLGDRALLLDLWHEIIRKGDPYYNSGFQLESLDYSLR